MIQQMDTAAGSRAGTATKSKRFAGKRVAMVTFSPFPFDPRPRRAVEALVGEGASVDLICLGGDEAPKHEILNGVNVRRLAMKHERRGKLEYGYRYGAFILVSSAIFAIRSLARRYDLVYVHNMPDILVLSALIPKALGAKVVLDLHDPMPELMMTIFNSTSDSKSVGMMKRLEKWSIARTDLVVTASVTFKRIFSSRSCSAEKNRHGYEFTRRPDFPLLPGKSWQPREPRQERTIRDHVSRINRRTEWAGRSN